MGANSKNIGKIWVRKNKYLPKPGSARKPLKKITFAPQNQEP